MSLDHPVQGFAIDAQDARCCLLVTAGMFKHAGDVISLDCG
jgi:hypothetical protein